MPLSWGMHKHLKQTGFLPLNAKQQRHIKGQAGVQRYDFATSYSKRTYGQIIVSVNGVRMTENHDYTVDYQNQEIIFNPEVQYIEGGENIVIHVVEEDANHIMLLPRKVGDFEFSDEQLSDFLHESVGEKFEVDQLIRNFPNFNADKLATLENCIIQIKQAKIAPEGIVGTEWVVVGRKRKGGNGA